MHSLDLAQTKYCQSSTVVPTVHCKVLKVRFRKEHYTFYEVTVLSLTENSRKELCEKAFEERELLASLEIDETLRQATTKNYLNIYNKSNESDVDAAGTYAKFVL